MLCKTVLEMFLESLQDDVLPGKVVKLLVSMHS